MISQITYAAGVINTVNTPTNISLSTIGIPGPQGSPATITIGTITTGAPGSSVIITNSGTEFDAILDITIPHGSSFVFQGDWEAGAYSLLDIVNHDNIAWTCVVASTTEEPGVGTDWDSVIEGIDLDALISIQNTAVTAKDDAVIAETNAQGHETAASEYADEAQNWSSQTEDIEVETGLYSALHHAAKALASASAASANESNALTSETNALASENKAADWAEELEDIEVEVGKYSALHYAAKSSASASAASISEINAADDATQTGLDVIQTGEDAVATAADREQTGLDRTAVSADLIQTDEDTIATAADRVQTGIDAVAGTAAKNKAEDWAEEAENIEVEPGKYSARHYALKSAADVLVTTDDRIETTENVALTAADVVTTAANKTDAQDAASSAATQAANVGSMLGINFGSWLINNGELIVTHLTTTTPSIVDGDLVLTYEAL